MLGITNYANAYYMYRRFIAFYFGCEIIHAVQITLASLVQRNKDSNFSAPTLVFGVFAYKEIRISNFESESPIDQ